MRKAVKNEQSCDNSPYCGAKRHCPVDAILFDDEIERIIIDSGKCIGCGKCVLFCPYKAICMAEL